MIILIFLYSLSFQKYIKKKKITDKTLKINQNKLHNNSSFKVKNKIGKLIKTNSVLKSNKNKVEKNTNKANTVKNSYKINSAIKSNQKKSNHNSIKKSNRKIESNDRSIKKGVLSKMLNDKNKTESISRNSRSPDKCLSKESSELPDNTLNNKKRKKKNTDIPNYDADNMDEIILNVKKNKLDAAYQKEDNEEALFDEKENNENNIVKVKDFEHEENHSKKKKMLQALLEYSKHRNKNKLIPRNKLEERMIQRHGKVLK